MVYCKHFALTNFPFYLTPQPDDLFASAFRVIRAEITRLTLEAKQRRVLIVDEDHHLRNEVLEDMRLLINYNMDSENRLCVWCWWD